MKKSTIKTTITTLLFAACVTVFCVSYVYLKNGEAYGANIPEDCGYSIMYTTVEVHDGDSLYEIASAVLTENEVTAEYVTTEEEITEIQRLNRIGDRDFIHAGGYIVIPYVVAL